MTLKKRLVIALLTVGLIPFLIMGITSFINGKNAVEYEANAKLEMARDIKKHEIETYVEQLKKTMIAISFHKRVDAIFNDLNKQLKSYKIDKNEPFLITNKKEIKKIYKKHDSFMKGLNKRQDFEDVYFVSKYGHVMYSVEKKSDLAENLRTGQLTNSGLAKAWKSALETKKISFIDLSSYAPDGGKPAMFIGINIYEQDESKLKGILVAKMGINTINRIMQSRTGMGKSGETYLVGSDSLMRSDSYINPISHSVEQSFANPSKGSIKTEAVNSAFAGKTGVKIITSNNNSSVLSAYTLVDLFGTQWAIIAEIDEVEVFAPIYDMRNMAIILGLIFLGIIAILAMFIGNMLSKPIITAVNSIADANSQVVSASEQISESATALAEGSSTQASSIEEVSATVEQSTAINMQNAQNAKEADILAKDANSAAMDGNDRVQNLMKSMSHISSSSQQIAKIIKTIDEIAFQTNLLALNAAVEAARAGEHGLGFAVVADEVKNLASRSAQAAKETESIIQSSIEQVKTGNEIANETNEAFSEILDKIKKTSNLIGEIAISAKEQSDGMSQIAQAMSTVDGVTQQNAATSEEAAAAAEELNAQANAMLESVADIGSMVGIHVELGNMVDQVKTTKRITTQPIKKLENNHTIASTKPNLGSRKNDDVFPLDDADLKEF